MESASQLKNVPQLRRESVAECVWCFTDTNSAVSGSAGRPMFLRRSSKGWQWAGLRRLFCGGQSRLAAPPSTKRVARLAPVGIAVAALLVLGVAPGPPSSRRFFVNATTAGNVGTSAIASGNTLEALCAAWLLNRYASGTRVFERAQDVFKFALIGAGSTAISPRLAHEPGAGGFVDWENTVASGHMVAG
jgi:hypothetical protein